MSVWRKIKKTYKRFNQFLNDDSILSWIVNIILAFILIKFIVYPGLGLIFQTSYPIVAVVSGSMEHYTAHPCLIKSPQGYCVKFDETKYALCDKIYTEKQKKSFDNFWNDCGDFYFDYNITKDDFLSYPMKNGFNTGDMMILFGSKNIKVGDIIVFMSNRGEPIIHRVIEKNINSSLVTYRTKGDHNPTTYDFESNITQDQIIGKAVLRVPLLGYVKILFFRLIGLFI